ncbi:uroporphyrinogen-III synthase [Stappia indica]|uniref:uroporphyrinogen-III synthase n=1 Tax=Stappia indica TaxID=538381 RepID=UPI00082E6117|nr:uroporphyrinogen-III synthase [Stappia indica]
MARVLVTRPAPAADRSAARYRAAGHEVHVAPLLAFAPLDPGPGALPPAKGLAALVATSARGIEAAGPFLSPAHYALPLHAVGEATARAARAAGFADTHAAEGDLIALAAALRAALPRGSEVLHLAPRDRSGDLAALLQDAGIGCRLVELYAMDPVGHLPEDVRAALVAGSGPVVAPVYSRRSAQALADALVAWGDRPAFRFLAISAEAGEPLAGLGPVELAKTPDEAGLMALLPG